MSLSNVRRFWSPGRAHKYIYLELPDEIPPVKNQNIRVSHPSRARLFSFLRRFPSFHAFGEFPSSLCELLGTTAQETDPRSSRSWSKTRANYLLLSFCCAASGHRSRRDRSTPHFPTRFYSVAPRPAALTGRPRLLACILDYHELKRIIFDDETGFGKTL